MHGLFGVRESVISFQPCSVPGLKRSCYIQEGKCYFIMLIIRQFACQQVLEQ